MAPLDTLGETLPGHGCQVPASGYQVSGIRAIFILHHASCILHPYLNRALIPQSFVDDVPKRLASQKPLQVVGELPDDAGPVTIGSDASYVRGDKHVREAP